MKTGILALLIFILLAGVASATVIDFDSYSSIQAIENDYNLDFSSLWDVKTDGTANQVGFFIDFADASEYIIFAASPVKMQSVYILSSGGTMAGLKDGAQVESMPLPINTPVTVDLSGWALIDKLVFNSYMVTVDDLSYNNSINTPIPSAMYLLGGGLLVFAGLKRKSQT